MAQDQNLDSVPLNKNKVKLLKGFTGFGKSSCGKNRHKPESVTRLNIFAYYYFLAFIIEN